MRSLSFLLFAGSAKNFVALCTKQTTHGEADPIELPQHGAAGKEPQGDLLAGHPERFITARGAGGLRQF